ncbi:alkaline phosphatase [Microbacterium sp. P02]|uniref:alkaline phosphatase n=1 Tax=Microbacterium sp. P02 TaxID=3366260 RepID=UPI00367020E4
MTLSSTTSRRVAAWLAVAALAAGGIGMAAPAVAAESDDDPSITENGGAARRDGDHTQALRDSIKDTPAKNVILLIGDGMGDSEITVARNYAEGAAGEFAGIDALPLTGSYTTYAVNDDGTINYASESASTASGWSTGTKTVNGKLSVDYLDNPQSTLLELAKANGKKTGNVSTAEIQDATPGAEIAHISARSCYGPVATALTCPDETVEAGGLGSISEQLLNVRPDVTLGGGSKSFLETATAGPWAGQSLFAQAADRGYQVVGDAAGLDAVTAADQTQPVLGLFSEGNFPVRWEGPAATIGGGDLPAASCTENPARLDTGLSLASLTTKAIELLDNENGFFLQVEGASIDKQDHAANACGQIGETVDLDEAVQAALAFAEQDKNTLVVVTADHAHTSQIVGATPPGASVNLLTTEGNPMIVSYGTAPVGSSQQHTGSQVRIAAYGPGAGNVVGLLDQTDLFFISADALELNRDLGALSAGVTVTASPAEVLPGDEVTITVSGLAGDHQVTATLGSDPVDLGQRDLISGTTTYTVTAPEEVGTYGVTVTGAQTGTTAQATFAVTETPASPAPAPSTSESPAAAAGGVSSGGMLGSTGGGVPAMAIMAAIALIATGMVLRARKRQRSIV